MIMGKPAMIMHGQFTPEPWQERAACRTSPDPDAWFPGQGETTLPRAQFAIRICRSCPVRLQCLEGAVQRGENEGIWGGYTTAQRNQLVREARARRSAQDGAAA
jgi:WhiB family redox-sensing transcriptional regulator